jgi:3-deoxy-7-phosphoheptulonate synthase
MIIPSASSFKTRFPISDSIIHFVEKNRNTARALLKGEDPRLLIVVGPCSLHDTESILQYGYRLQLLAKEVEESCFLVMRAFIEKPRTILGWKGLIHEPDLDGKVDLFKGISLSRELLIELSHHHVPLATEFLDPLIAPYIEDLITWGFIGARTTTSQIHRQLASALKCPVGFKNSLDGVIEHAVNGVVAANAPQDFLHLDDQGALTIKNSPGNPDCHIVLRGSMDKSNYDSASVQEALALLNERRIAKRLLIDCAHGNSLKKPGKQVETFNDILGQIVDGEQRILGMMLESHLLEGSQPLSEDPTSLHYGISITDPCIDWKTTETLIMSAHEALCCLK